MILSLVFLFALAPQSDSITSVYDTPDYRLTLGDRVFDPLTAHPRRDSRHQTKVEGGSERFFLLQFQGIIQSSWLEELRAEGLQPVRYLHPFTYVVWGNPQDLNRLGRRPHVRWVGDFLPEYRLLSRHRNLSAEGITVRLLTWAGVDATETQLQLQALGGTNIQERRLDDQFTIIACTIGGDQLAQVAQLPGVYTVQPVPTDGGVRGELSCQVTAGNISQVMVGMDLVDQVDVGYRAWLAGLGLDGSGVLMANVDTGVRQTHPDLVGRFVPCTGETCDENDTISNQHGTHTAGIMAGDGASEEKDAAGYLRGLGMAPGATMIEQITSGNYSGVEGMRLLIRESWENGAILSNNSWGPSGRPLGYDLHTMEVDLSVRDASPLTPGNQPFSFVLAIMNGGGQVSTQGTPDEAKNLISVGSTYVQDGTGALHPNRTNISSNSAHGPCLDGRLLPNLVAPGAFVDSTSGSAGYQLLLGTSMAAPHVAGAAALFVEHYRNINAGADPSPELLKAALLVTARDLFGGLDASGEPLTRRVNAQQGWGILDTAALLDPITETVYVDRPRVLQSSGDVWQGHYEVVDPALPASLMLVWTDAAGHGLGGATPAWNNDLDLEVSYDGNTYTGNVFNADGWSTPGGMADAIHNTEGVFLGPTATGDLVARVVARQLTSDGIPNTGSSVDQDFALVCVNCRPTVSFFVETDTNYLSLCDETSADIVVSLIDQNGFVDPITLTVDNVPNGVTAVFDDTERNTGEQTTLRLTGLDTLPPGEYPMSIIGSGGGVDPWQDSRTLVIARHGAAPAKVALSQPLAGSSHQLLTPTFSWASQNLVQTYRFELGLTDTLDTPIYTETLVANQLDLPVTLDYGTHYYWRVIARNNCGEGEVVTARSFTTQQAPDVLLVDDDNNSPDSRALYQSILDFWGVNYVVYNTFNTFMEPEPEELAPYKLVLWFSGEAKTVGNSGPRSGPKSQTEINLGTFLDNGGALLLTAQSYFKDRGTYVDNGTDNPDQIPNGFMNLYLGLAAATPQVGYTQATGIAPELESLGTQDLAFGPIDNDTTTLEAQETAVPAFESNGQVTGIFNGEGVLPDTYKTLFLGFPLETIDNIELRNMFPTLLSKLGVTVNSSCLNDDNFRAKTPFWPEQDIRGLVGCLNAYKTE